MELFIRRKGGRIQYPKQNQSIQKFSEGLLWCKCVNIYNYEPHCKECCNIPTCLTISLKLHKPLMTNLFH